MIAFEDEIRVRRPECQAESRGEVRSETAHVEWRGGREEEERRVVEEWRVCR